MRPLHSLIFASLLWVACAGKSERAIDAMGGHAGESPGAGGGSAGSGAGSDSGGSGDSTLPPGPDRALMAEEESFCDVATGTFGVIVRVDSCVISTPMETECITIADRTTVRVFDLESGTLEISFSALALDDAVRYVEASLSSLENEYDCDELANLVFVSETVDQTNVRTFEKRRVQSAAYYAWSFDTGCEVTLALHSGPEVDRLAIYAFRDGATRLIGPFESSGPDATGEWTVTAPLPEYCEPGRILIGAGFLDGALVFLGAT